MKPRKVLIVSLDSQCKTLDIVKSVLHKHSTANSVIPRKNLSKRYFKNNDLIIVVGGDGTFLRTSHFITDKTPVLGVNSDAKHKEGFFMRADKDNFSRIFERVIKDKFKITKLTRLETRINNKLIPDLVLNELFFGNKKVYHTSHYTLQGEPQKSSGVLVGTAAGSNSWIKSAGGKVLPLTSRRFQFIVREPYQGRLTRIKLTKGILNANEKLTIKSGIDNCIVVIDSVSKEFPISKGDIITIKNSKNELRLLDF
jgi:NAD+ kinase